MLSQNVATDALPGNTAGYHGDAADMPKIASGFILRVSQTLTVTSKDGTVNAFAAGELAVGVPIGLSIRRLWDTGTADVSKVTLLFGKY